MELNLQATYLAVLMPTAPLGQMITANCPLTPRAEAKTGSLLFNLNCLDAIIKTTSTSQESQSPPTLEKWRCVVMVPGRKGDQVGEQRVALVPEKAGVWRLQALLLGPMREKK